MDTVASLLVEVRKQIEAPDDGLREARQRLTLVLSKAASFYGTLRTYRSGSLAAHTMNAPVTDGDGGLVLNRNYYPRLGPDGLDEEAPEDIVEELIEHLRPLLRETYPDVKMYKSKRGPKIHFFAPLADGTDPTVDIVVAMSRKKGNGLWIPDLKAGEWEASDPEGHITLFNDSTPAVRSTRRKIMRLAKAWNKQADKPGASSFLMSVWAYEFVEPGMGVANGLMALLEGAAARLVAGEPTRDPAGVSPDLSTKIDSETMALRLSKAAGHLRTALDASSEEEIQDAMSRVFYNYLTAPSTAGLFGSINLLKSGKEVSAAALGVGVVASTAAAARSRAYGENAG